jgi:hypothetical protein
MNIKISSDSLKSVAHVAGKAAKFIKNSSLEKQSLTRMGRDSILQTPVISSSAIGTDETIIIARAIEKYIASMAVSGFSMRVVDLDKNDDIAQYIKRFHNNDDIPSNLKAATKFVMESANYVDDAQLQASEVDILSCWNVTNEQVNMESLNDMYKPYESTKNIIEDKIQKLTSANEGVLDKNSKLNSFLDKMNSKSESDVKNTAQMNTEITEKTNTKITAKGEKETTKETVVSKKQVMPNTFNAIVKNDKLTALEPTMANVQFVVHGGKGDSKQFVQNVVLGFKAMVRIVRSDIMVANMIEAAKNSNMIFKFIKWTKGEFKFIKDVIFNITEIKDSVISDSNDKNFLNAIKRRKEISNITKFLDNRVPPSTIIIMSSYEVARVAEVTGVDLSQIHNALRLLNKYYLIGFGVYDTETKILSMLFDGEGEFVETTIDSLKSSSDRNSSMISMSDAMKAFGRM